MVELGLRQKVIEAKFMDLRIKRSKNIKKKGMLSSAVSVEFILQLQLILDPEEADLIETYQKSLPAVHWIELSTNAKDTKYYFIQDLIKGLEFRDCMIRGIMEIEDHIKERMLTIQSLLESARDFNSVKIIKFNIRTVLSKFFVQSVTFIYRISF